jgi:hypothetical protein
MFSVKKISQVEQIDLSESDMQLSEVDIDQVTRIGSVSNEQKPTNNSNPLFVNPNRAPKNNEGGGERVKIRV